MDEVDELIGLARDLAKEVVGIASEMLYAGIDLERVQGRYVTLAVEHLAEAEVQGVRAATGDEDALAALTEVAVALADLRDMARAEAGGQTGADPE
jgi:hypothetical protein